MLGYRKEARVKCTRSAMVLADFMHLDLDLELELEAGRSAEA
jgi:hypothetical protein